MRKRGQEQELTKYGHERRGNTRHGETQSDITPPSQTVCPAPYTIQRGGGWVLWRTPGDRRQDYQPPGPGAMADPGTREAMADPGSRGAMADQGILWPWPLALLHRPWLYAPPKKTFLGEVPLWEQFRRNGLCGALWTRGHLGALGKRQLQLTAAGIPIKDLKTSILILVILWLKSFFVCFFVLFFG